MAIHHIAFRTHQFEALVDFYCDVWQLPVLRQSDVSTWLAMGEGVLMVEAANPTEPKIPAGSMEFVALRASADEINAARGRLEQRGVSIEYETQFTLYFRDPDGRRVGMSCYPLPHLTR